MKMRHLPGSPEGLIFKGIHESVSFIGSESIKYDPSIIIEPYCSFIFGPEADINFGRNVTIYSGCSFRSKYGIWNISDEVSFGPRCIVYELRAGLSIGAHSMIAAGVCISGVNHGMNNCDIPYRFQMPTELPVTIGKNVWIGMNASILPGITIGDNAIIGAGSIVTRDIPASTLAYGTPCRPVRKLERNTN